MTYMDKLFEDISPERFYALRERFDKFIAALDKDTPPISVYDPLRPEQLDQLKVIREVSQELQRKKEEDVLKAKQAAEEASKAAAEAEKNKEEKEEEKEGEQDTEDSEETKKD